MEKEGSKASTRYEVKSELIADPVKKAYEIDGVGVDDHLQAIVDMVNDSASGLTLGITIFTSTGVITGTLISLRLYCEKMGASLQESLERSFPESNFDGYAAKYASLGIESDDMEEGKYRTSAQFIHLDNATLFMDSGAPLLKKGLLWRGKIQSVNGFTLGKLV